MKNLGVVCTALFAFDKRIHAVVKTSLFALLQRASMASVCLDCCVFIQSVTAWPTAAAQLLNWLMRARPDITRVGFLRSASC